MSKLIENDFKTKFFDAMKMLAEKKSGNPNKYFISYFVMPPETNYFDNITFTANNRFDLWLKVYNYLCEKNIEYANTKFYEEDAYLLDIEEHMTMVNMMNFKEYLDMNIDKNSNCVEQIYKKMNEKRKNNLLWNFDKDLYDQIEDINIRFIIHQLMYAFDTGSRSVYFSNTRYNIVIE
jgi:hypothetical protein